MTIVEFLTARLETDRGEAQYVLNLLSAGDAPVMLGSLRSAIINTCERVLADVATKLAIIEDKDEYDGYDQWAKTVARMAADYSGHSDYREAVANWS